MDSLYFPGFLVILAAIVIWLYNRSSRATKELEKEKARRRRENSSATRINKAGQSRPARRAPASGSAGTPNAVWSARKRRAKHKVSGKQAPADVSRTMQANYLGPNAISGRSSSDNPILDQKVSDIDHVGFDEFLAQQREKVVDSDADDAGDFTMSAIKYESNEDEADEEAPKKQLSGFKP